MKVGLYDVDSKIPNLALMKISAYHKSKGDDVEMYQPLFRHEYGKVYASKIFNFSNGSLLDDGMEIGGVGYDMTKRLPPEIDSMIPDYSLYDYPHSIGYAMRGCRLKCSFCVVPKIEGAARSNDAIEDIWTQRESDFIVLLDNDFFGNPNWKECIDSIKRNNLKVNFLQGLNIRSITNEQAEALASVRFSNRKQTGKQVCFAWDNIKEERQVMRGIAKCVNAGIKTTQMMFYVLIGYNSTEAEDMHRIETLRKLGCDPFVMPFDKSEPYQRDCTRWVNNKAVFKSVPWAEYRGSKKAIPKPSPDQIVMFQ